MSECTVVGNSHGGALSIQLGLRRPELVKKLVLMAPGGLETREVYMEMSGIRSMFKAVTCTRGHHPREPAQGAFAAARDPGLLTDDILDERLEIAVTQPKRVLVSLQVPHLAPELPNMRCPVFGLWGVNDQFCPVSGASRIAEHCPDARVLLVGRCGHWVMIEHPDLFNRLALDFLREN